MLKFSEPKLYLITKQIFFIGPHLTKNQTDWVGWNQDRCVRNGNREPTCAIPTHMVYQITFPVVAQQKFVHILQDLETIDLAFVTYHGHDVFFIIEKRQDSYEAGNDVIHVRLPTNTLSSRVACLDWILDLNKKESFLESLLLTSVSHCRGWFEGFGGWILQFMDAVHTRLGIDVCRLVDASRIMGIQAICLYSSTHGGLSWYMSHGYLLDLPIEDVTTQIAATNQTIQSWYLFWNEIDRDRRFTSSICSMMPRQEEVNMIKYYNKPVALVRTSEPAYFTWEGKKPNIPSYSKPFTIYFPFHFLNHFRLEDCVDFKCEYVKDKFIHFFDTNYTIKTRAQMENITVITSPLHDLIYNPKNVKWGIYFHELQQFLPNSKLLEFLKTVCP